MVLLESCKRLGGTMTKVEMYASLKGKHMLALYITVLYSYIVFFFVPKTFKKKFTCSESVVQEKKKALYSIASFFAD